MSLGNELRMGRERRYGKLKKRKKCESIIFENGMNLPGKLSGPAWDLKTWISSEAVQHNVCFPWIHARLGQVQVKWRAGFKFSWFCPVNAVEWEDSREFGEHWFLDAPEGVRVPGDDGWWEYGRPDVFTGTTNQRNAEQRAHHVKWMVRRWNNCQSNMGGGMVIKDGRATGDGVKLKVISGDKVKEWRPRNRKGHPCFTCINNMFQSRQNSCVMLVVKIMVVWGMKEGQWLGGVWEEWGGFWRLVMFCVLIQVLIAQVCMLTLWKFIKLYFLISCALPSIFVIIQYRIKTINRKKTPMKIVNQVASKIK